MLVAVTLEQCWHDVPGGTAAAALGLTRALTALPGIDVVGVAARHATPPRAPWKPDVRMAHHRLPRTALYTSWHSAGRPLIEEATGTVDVVHATGVAVPGTKAPLVVTVHDLAFERFPDHPTRWGLRFFRQAVERAKERADAIICPSAATATDCIDHGFDGDRVHVVPWGTDWSPATTEAVDAARSELDLPDRYIVWVGTIEPRKNLAGLLAAFALLDDDIDLVLVGPSGWGEQPEPAPEVASRVHFTGFVPAALLPAIYRGATVACYPSLLEGFGLPVLEAMSQGTPVVTSAKTATEEVLGSGGLAVDPTDPTEMADALQSIISAPAERARLGTAAIEQAANFTWSRTAELTADVYGLVQR